ncbi:MAG: hypothetical protein ACRELB_21460 [Polyangiaceae bacterium]
MLWAGWLEVRSDGYLSIATHVIGHAGRLTEVAASLGEALALYVAERLLGYSYLLFQRVKETDPLGMDFVAKVSTGEVALEAKARGRWAKKGARKEIRAQFQKRSSAVEKYGFILLYQQGKCGKRRKSYVQLVDPPGTPVPPTPDEMLRSILEHYYQVSMTIGLWFLATDLSQQLGLPSPERPVQGDVLERIRQDPQRSPGNRIRIHGRTFVGRFFMRPDAEPESPEDEALFRDWPYFYYGIDVDIVRILFERPSDALDRLLAYSRTYLGGSAFRVEGSQGPIRYAALSDGVLRVDVATREQLEHEDFDVPPERPAR